MNVSEVSRFKKANSPRSQIQLVSFNIANCFSLSKPFTAAFYLLYALTVRHFYIKLTIDKILANILDI